MKISVLKVRQLKRRSCRVAAPTTKAHLKKAAELLKLKLKTLKIQTPKIKNSCEKTKVTKKYHKFQRFNRKNYVLLIITFLQINLPLSFVMFCDDDFIDAIVYQSNLYNTQRSIDGYRLPTNKRSSSEKSFRSVKPVSKAEIKNLFGIILYMGVCKISK